MSEILRDVRFKATSETLVVLMAMAEAEGRDLSQFLRAMCEERVSTFIHAVNLADKRLKSQGEPGILRDQKKNAYRAG